MMALPSLPVVADLAGWLRKNPPPGAPIEWTAAAARQLHTALPVILAAVEEAVEFARAQEAPSARTLGAKHQRPTNAFERIFTDLEAWSQKYGSDILRDETAKRCYIRSTGALTALRIVIRRASAAQTLGSVRSKRGPKRDHWRHQMLYHLAFWWRVQGWPLSLKRAAGGITRDSTFVALAQRLVAMYNDEVLLHDQPRREMALRSQELRWADSSAKMAYERFITDGLMGVLHPNAVAEPVAFLRERPLRLKFEADCVMKEAPRVHPGTRRRQPTRVALKSSTRSPRNSKPVANVTVDDRFLSVALPRRT